MNVEITLLSFLESGDEGGLIMQQRHLDSISGLRSIVPAARRYRLQGYRAIMKLEMAAKAGFFYHYKEA
jgi:hypothetical protein